MLQIETKQQGGPASQPKTPTKVPVPIVVVLEWLAVASLEDFDDVGVG